MPNYRIIVLVLALLAVGACSVMTSIGPIDPPARSSFDAALIARGAQLAAIGNCADCHTAEGGKPYAGGRPLKTPLGTIYGTNITPDLETGIGRWSEGAFARAMREGLDREGRHLYPAFPYDHFTKVTDEDIRALYAFVMTREPVRAETPLNELPFPFNVRSAIGVWKRLYFEPSRFRPDPAQSAEWNRGAYLAQGLGHCGACHTPRNRLGAEEKHRDFAGGEVAGWHGPALNADSPAPVPWTARQLYIYLRTGLEPQHAIAAGPMEPVVRNLATVSERDVQALAIYVAARMGAPAPERRKAGEDALAHARRDIAAYPFVERVPTNVAGDDRAFRSGAAVYAGACAECHDRGRLATSGSGLHLALGSAVTIPTSANLIRITLEGIIPPDSDPARWMPGFAGALTDEQVKDLVYYMRTHFSRAPPWHDVDAELKKAKAAAKR